MNSSRVPGRSAQILLVEDSPTDRLLTIAALEQSKILNTLHTVENGVDAMAFLRREGRFSDAPRPDVVLLDLNLPKMDGREVLQRVKSDPLLARIPVIVLTTSRADEDVLRAYGSHANSYITKPLDLAQFGKALATFGDYWFQVVTLPPPQGKTTSSPPLRRGSIRRVLLVEDSPTDALLASEALSASKVFGPFEVVHVDRIGAALELLSRETFSVVVSDVSLPDSQGANTWRILRGAIGNAPLVVLTGSDDDTLGQQAMADGADDYLTKNLVSTLPRVAAYALDRRATQERLLHSQRMEAMGRLAGGVAHDFNNLLTIVQVNAALIDSDAPAARIEEARQEILEAAQKGATLSRQLLAFSRKQIINRQVLDINEVVGGTIRMIRRLLGDLQIELRVSADTLIVNADHTMLEQVLLNLAVNARDAMPNGGKLSVSTRRETIEPGSLRGLSKDAYPGDFAVACVSDTGTGIAPEVLEQIWDPFFTTKTDGTGLGLATAFGIIVQHQGWIHVESTPGHGSTFSVFLPVSSGQVPVPVQEVQVSTKGPAGRCVLIVDDERGIRRSVARILDRSGYTTLQACRGEEALALLDAGERVHLVVTDMTVPDGMGGRELFQELKDRFPDIPVVFCSGYSQSANEVDLPHGGDFLAKPFTADELLATVAARLERTE